MQLALPSQATVASSATSNVHIARSAQVRFAPSPLDSEQLLMPEQVAVQCSPHDPLQVLFSAQSSGQGAIEQLSVYQPQLPPLQPPAAPSEALSSKRRAPL